MKEIKHIIEQIEDECKGANEYIDDALEHKQNRKSLADLYYNLSLQELSHLDSLHNQVVALINEQKNKGVEIPDCMQDIYDWEHKRIIDKVAKVKVKQNMYKS